MSSSFFGNFSNLTHLFFISVYCFLFAYYVFRLFSSIYLFFFFLCRSLDFPSHPKTQQKKNKKSKIQNPDQKASKRVCPTRVCPTHVSAQQLCPQCLFLNSLTIHFDEKIGLFAPYFCSCYQSCGVLHGILVHDWSPPRIKTFFSFCKFISTVSKTSSWKSPKNCAKFGS